MHCTYEIDARDVIRAFDSAFAEQWTRDCGGDAAATVLGTPLFDHVDGQVVRGLLRGLLGRVRDGTATLELPYRCDTPDARRWGELVLRPLPNGGVLVRSVLRQIEPRARVEHPQRAREGEVPDMLLMCSWCNRVESGAWVEIEEALRRLGGLAEAAGRLLTHGICPECEAGLLAATREQHRSFPDAVLP